MTDQENWRDEQMQTLRAEVARLKEELSLSKSNYTILKNSCDHRGAEIARLTAEDARKKTEYDTLYARFQENERLRRQMQRAGEELSDKCDRLTAERDALVKCDRVGNCYYILSNFLIGAGLTDEGWNGPLEDLISLLCQKYTELSTQLAELRKDEERLIDALQLWNRVYASQDSGEQDLENAYKNGCAVLDEVQPNDAAIDAERKEKA